MRLSRRGFMLSLGPLVLGVAAPARAADVEALLFDLQIIPLDGPPAQDFALQGLDGKRWSLADIRRRPALLYFWAST